jgi:hypothetical protein
MPRGGRVGYDARMTKTRWLVVTCAALAACGKKSGDGGGGGDGLPPELAKWMPADATKLLQGAWQTRISFYKKDDLKLDALAALEISGDKAKAWDGAKEHALGVEVSAPCRLSLSEQFDGGMRASYDKHFLVAGGKLVAVGDGAAGYRKGKEAIVCQLGLDYVITAGADGACKSWRHDSFQKQWSDKPIDCSWSTKDGKDVLIVGKADDQWASKLVADGDLLMAAQLQTEAKEERFMKHAADYAAAKAWVDAELKKKTEK